MKRTTSSRPPADYREQDALVMPALEHEADLAAERHGDALFKAMLEASDSGKGNDRE
jgi:hypothetical protein